MHKHSLAYLAISAAGWGRNRVSDRAMTPAEPDHSVVPDEELETAEGISWSRWALIAIAAIWVGFQVYTAIGGTFTLWIQRGVHLAFGISLIFLMRPLDMGLPGRVIDFFLTAATVLIFGYVAYENVSLTMRFPYVDPMSPGQIAIGVTGICLVLEAARRTVGATFTLIAIIFCLYLFVGPYLPGVLGHRGFDFKTVVEHIFFTTEGVFGVPVAVSATYVFLFILFGVVLESTGAGKFFLELITGQVGHFRGGPAKVAVVSSAAMGTISGSAIANVVTTGTFTIPMMRRIGFNPNYAAGVEAMASTGGQLTPPILGVAAFIMAQFSGIPYADIAWAAVLPALLYYNCGLWQIHFHAKKHNVPTIPRDQLPPFWPVFRQGWFFLPPLAVIVLLLFEGYTAIFAALYGLAAVLAGAILFGDRSKVAPLQLLLMCEKLARAILPIIGAVSAAGIIVGAVTLSGIGVNISRLLVDTAAQSQLLALVITMIVATILGLGMPTSAAYILAAAVLVPSLIDIGISPLAAHFFALYYASLSVITPPVALASYAAASIAGGDPWRTGLQGFKLALAAYLVPFFFAYNNALLGQGGVIQIGLALITGVIGTFALAGAIEGFMFGRMAYWQRALAAVGAILLVFAGWRTDLVGAALILVATISFSGRSKADIAE